MTAQKRNSSAENELRKPAKQPSGKSVEPSKPLKPRPFLFVVLSIVLALWLVALVVMRLRTVNPPPTYQTEPAPSAAP